MKKMIIMAAMATVALSASADFYVNYATVFGISAGADIDPIGNAPLLANGEQARVQLIYAGADGIANYLSTEDQGGGIFKYNLGSAGGVYGDDVVLADFMSPVAISGDGFTEFGIFQQLVQSAFLGAGEVSGRIYNGDESVFFQGHIQTMTDKIIGSPPPTQELYNLGENGTAFAGQDAAGNVYQVIPEPATLGLMGVAGLGMFLARKKSRR